MEFYVLQALSGLASASALFLVASGLSLIFGVTRIINFAHGTAYMLGAYLGYSLTALLMAETGPLVKQAGLTPETAEMAGFWLGLSGAALGAALGGALIEISILRRLYNSGELMPLLATFAVVLIAQDAVRSIWGPAELLGPRAPGLEGTVRLLSGRLPEYDLFLIALAPTILALLWLLMHRTRFGLLIRAATNDREMLAALGTDARWLMTGVFALGAGLAGLGGALQLPRATANLEMDLSIIAEAFVVVVIGGMGSLTGAYLAAITVGIVQAFALLFLPEASLVTIFALMAVVLILRPQGLLGKRDLSPPPIGREARFLSALTAPSARPPWVAILLGLGALAAVPLTAGPFVTSMVAETLVLALYAYSLALLIGVAGIISFGHAALFGAGAYGFAFAITWLEVPFWTAAAAGPLAGAVIGYATGLVAVRRQGVYRAMLTLAAAQVLWSLATQWIAVTGGDNGILGLTPPPPFHEGAPLFWLILALATLGLIPLIALRFAPFGRSLSAIADAPARAAAIGLDASARHRWTFAAAGLAAGLAGTGHAMLKGSVFPNDLSIALSVDGLVMVLLGGLTHLFGPLIGAAGFQAIKIGFADTVYWRAVLGGLLLTLILIAPMGLGGTLSALKARLSPKTRTTGDPSA